VELVAKHPPQLGIPISPVHELFYRLLKLVNVENSFHLNFFSKYKSCSERTMPVLSTDGTPSCRTWRGLRFLIGRIGLPGLHRGHCALGPRWSVALMPHAPFVKYAETVVVDAAVKVTAVPTSATAHGTPVIGRMVGLAPTVNLIDVAVPACVKVITPVVSAAVPEMSNCQTLIF